MSGALALYRIADQLRELTTLAEQNIDEIPEEVLLDTLEGLQGELQIKATNVAAFALNLEAYAEAALDAAKKLTERAKRIDRRAATMREYIRVNMAKTGTKKIEGPEFTISRVNNPPAVIITPEAKVAAEYCKAPSPLIAAIVDKAFSTCMVGVSTIIISREELAEAIANCLPQPEPDRKKIADTLKPIYKAHEAAVAEAKKNSQPIPLRPDPIHGCSLEQSERLAIKV